ncbi:MAG: acylphosphatase [Rhodomicrobiaceae bacterium]
MEAENVRVRIRGRVQGVGFRAWIANHARRLGLTGWVRNRRDGSVEAVFCGAAEDVEAMVALSRDGPRSAEVEEVEASRDEPPAGIVSFEILPTQ